MNKQKQSMTENKVAVGITLDSEVVRAINQQRGHAKKSTYINYLLRDALGMGAEA